MTDLALTAVRLMSLSEWIDESNAHRDKEAQLWGRVSKVGEENGEVVAALIGATGQNPRKGVTHTTDDVAKELLDVAVTALAAVEHIFDNDGSAVYRFARHLGAVCVRAGVGHVGE